MKMTANKKKEVLFNSRFEVCLRILLLLSKATVWPLSTSTISNIDFMAIYGREFGISGFDLHGENRYKFSQLAARKSLIEEAIKKLVRLKLVAVDTTNGFRYMINDNGTDLIERMDDTYSCSYRKAIAEIFKKYDVSQPKELEKILKKARVRKENDDYV